MTDLALTDHAPAPAPCTVVDQPCTTPRHDPIDAPTPPARFSALEWSVVAIARRDRLSSLRRPGRITTALRGVFGRPNPQLADERLEALRRMAVWSWHHGYAVPSSQLRAFLNAGFSLDQYETMLTSIGVAHRRGDRR